MDEIMHQLRLRLDHHDEDINRQEGDLRELRQDLKLVHLDANQKLEQLERSIQDLVNTLNTHVIAEKDARIKEHVEKLKATRVLVLAILSVTGSVLLSTFLVYFEWWLNAPTTN